MKRILLLSSLTLAGLVSLAYARDAVVLQHVTDKAIDREIRQGMMPLQMKVTPHMFSRRMIPNRETLDYYVTVQPSADAEVVPFSVVKVAGFSLERGNIEALTKQLNGEGPARTTVHYADAKLIRATKKVELAWVDPLTGKRSYLPVADWLKRTAPAS